MSAYRVHEVGLEHVLATSSTHRLELRADLQSGEVAAIPTESSYGLAALPDSQRGVDKIFRIKGRDDHKPLPVVIADSEQAGALGVDLEHPLWRWASDRWPAPLSVVVPTRRELVAQRGAAGLAVRIPAYAPLRRLLTSLGVGLTATSANRSGADALLRSAEVAELLESQGGWLIDAGDLPGGPPSTVVAWNERRSEPVVLRQGAYRL